MVFSFWAVARRFGARVAAFVSAAGTRVGVCSVVPFLMILDVAPGAAEPLAPTTVRATLTAYVKAHPSAMVAVGVIDHGRATTYFARGVRAKGVLDEHTRFQIGSITKVFTATALAQAVLRGDLTLTDRLQDHLPAGVVAPAYRGQPITPLSLATHMSGLPADPPNLGSLRALPEYSIRQLDDALSGTKLSRAPGSRWEYSNFGFAVLGQVLATAGHRPYETLVENDIFEPLGMTRSVVSGSARTRRRLAPSSEYGGDPAPIMSIGVALEPAGSIESDLKDMTAFLKANLEAPRGPLGRELAFAQQPRTTVREYDMAMGLGWQTVLPRTHRVPGDLGDVPAGSLEKGGNIGGYSSFIALNHGAKWAIVAMTNVNDDDFQQVIAHAVSPETAHMPVLWTTVRREPSPFSGRYLIGTRNVVTLDVFKYRGDLYGWIRSSTPAKLTLRAPGRYSFDSLQIELTFHRNRSGRVTGLTAVQHGKTLRARRAPA